MVSLIGELDAREAATRVRVEELEAQIVELTARLEGEREVDAQSPPREPWGAVEPKSQVPT